MPIGWRLETLLTGCFTFISFINWTFVKRLTDSSRYTKIFYNFIIAKPSQTSARACQAEYQSDLCGVFSHKQYYY